MDMAASMASPCIVHEMQDLNTSDHVRSPADLRVPVIYGTHPFTEAWGSLDKRWLEEGRR